MVGTAPAGTGREVTVSLLSCSALGVIQWLVTLGKMNCFVILEKKFATCGNGASIFLQGLHTFQKITKEQQCPCRALGRRVLSAAQQLGEAKLRYSKIRLRIELKAGNSVPHV